MRVGRPVAQLTHIDYMTPMPKKCIGIYLILTFDTRLEAIRYWTVVRLGKARLVVGSTVQSKIESIAQSIVQSRVQVCTYPSSFLSHNGDHLFFQY